MGEVELADFKPYPPQIAAALAKQADELYQTSEFFRPKNPFPCSICTHPNRQRIDYAILIDAKGPELREAAGKDPSPTGPDRGRWNRGRFREHREKHLRPMVERSIIPTVHNFRRIPLPGSDAPPRDKAEWYMKQHCAIYLSAFEEGKWQAAIWALKEMRAIDVGLPLKLADHGTPQPDNSVPEPVGQVGQAREDRLLSAFAKSRPRAAVEDVEVENAENENQG